MSPRRGGRRGRWATGCSDVGSAGETCGCGSVSASGWPAWTRNAAISSRSCSAPMRPATAPSSSAWPRGPEAAPTLSLRTASSARRNTTSASRPSVHSSKGLASSTRIVRVAATGRGSISTAQNDRRGAFWRASARAGRRGFHGGCLMHPLHADRRWCAAESRQRDRLDPELQRWRNHLSRVVAAAQPASLRILGASCGGCPHWRRHGRPGRCRSSSRRRGPGATRRKRHRPSPTACAAHSHPGTARRVRAA